MKFNAKSLIKTAILFSIVFSVISCSTDKEVAPDSKEIQEREQLIGILVEQGFDKKDIRYINGKFLIGDIIILESELKKGTNIKGSASGARVSQRKYIYQVSNDYISNLKVYIHPDLPSEWVEASRLALEKWNNDISGVKVKYVEVNDPSLADTRIEANFDENLYNKYGYVAYAYYPFYDGKPGHEVQINTYFNYMDASVKLETVVHELGHTLGLDHSDANFSYGSQLIPGTPGDGEDPNSVMMSYVHPWGDGFTDGDKIAVRYLYPGSVTTTLGIFNVSIQEYPVAVTVNNTYIVKANISCSTPSTVKVELVNKNSGFVAGSCITSMDPITDNLIYFYVPVNNVPENSTDYYWKTSILTDNIEKVVASVSGIAAIVKNEIIIKAFPASVGPVIQSYLLTAEYFAKDSGKLRIHLLKPSDWSWYGLGEAPVDANEHKVVSITVPVIISPTLAHTYTWKGEFIKGPNTVPVDWRMIVHQDFKNNITCSN